MATGFVTTRKDSMARLSVWLTGHHRLQLLPLRYVTWRSVANSLAELPLENMVETQVCHGQNAVKHGYFMYFYVLPEKGW